MKQKGFFDENDRLAELSKIGDPLEKLNKFIKWEDFREMLAKAFSKEPKKPGGRPPSGYAMMFKILILQKLYNIADDKAGHLIKDRLSFQRFLGLALCDTVPDAKTIWNFREELKEAGIMEAVFDMFVGQMERKGIITRSGSIADATFVDVPRQQNTRAENGEIKGGKVPGEWEKEGNRHKRAQKDTDARWAVKNKEVHYGYKDHIKMDKKSKIITKFEVISAQAHDSYELENLIEPGKDRRLYGDGAYTGEGAQECIPENVQNRIHEKGYRNRPLTKTQERNNTAKSRIRARVEHVFGRMQQFGGITIRAIGVTRAKIQIRLLNMAYNLSRYTYLMGAKA
ncbi:MAG: IS5 family transposase [Treponema sp.]|jgi:IS5 family transposase|nr:IS5 family transposase [Treponema sp.]